MANPIRELYRCGFGGMQYNSVCNPLFKPRFSNQVSGTDGASVEIGSPRSSETKDGPFAGAVNGSA